MSGPALIALDIAGPGDPWGELGLMVADEVTQLGEVTLRFGHEGEGIVGWALRGGDGPRDLDGLPTTWLPKPIEPSAPREHRVAVPSVDHVVVATPDPRRTFSCFESAGLTLRRERAAGSEQRPLVQGFFRHGEAMVEVVGPREASGDGPAAFWGLTLVAEELDAIAAELGEERCSAPRDAVQP
nr:glyoxalase [Solirubrobacterales bacterium]